MGFGCLNSTASLTGYDWSTKKSMNLGNPKKNQRKSLKIGYRSSASTLIQSSPKNGSVLKLTSFLLAFPFSPQQMAGYTPQLRTHMIRTHDPIRKGSPTSPLFKVNYNWGFLTKKGSQPEELGDLLIGVLDFRLFLWLLNCWDRIDPHFFQIFVPGTRWTPTI